MTTATTASAPVILNADRLSAGQSRYWLAQIKQLTGRVDVIDPARRALKELRAELPAGTRVYRASTGGRWGKSATIAVL